MNNIKTLGIDYGSKVMGLAAYRPGSDPFPLGLGRLLTEDNQFWKQLTGIIEEEEIEQIVLGLPTYLDGSSSEMTEKVKEFGKLLELQFPQIPIIFEEETLTTKAAEDRMRNSPAFNFKVDKKRIDEVSAVIILEQFFKLGNKI